MWMLAAGGAVVVVFVVFVLGIAYGRAIERDVQAKMKQVSLWAEAKKDQAEAELRKLV